MLVWSRRNNFGVKLKHEHQYFFYRNECWNGVGGMVCGPLTFWENIIQPQDIRGNRFSFTEMINFKLLVFEIHENVGIFTRWEIIKIEHQS